MPIAAEPSPFADPDLWARSSLLARIPASAIAELPELELPKSTWPDVTPNTNYSVAIPDDENTEWLEAVADSIIADPNVPADVKGTDDSWSISTNDLERSQDQPARTWERFADPAFSEPCRYISEAGVAAFDAAVRGSLPPKSPGRPLKPHVFHKSLFQLGLGRDSILFSFNKDGTFSANISDPRMYGLTPESSKSIINRFGQSGQLFRSLKAQIARIYARSQSPPASVAVAQTLSSIILELDNQVTKKNPLQSLVQLEAAFRIPFETLALLRDVLSEVPRLKTDQLVLTYLYDLAQEVERSQPCLKPLVAQIVVRASEPWLRSVSACVGLRPLDPSSMSLYSLLTEDLELGHISDEDQDDSLFPQWFDSADRAMVRQIFEGMLLLKAQSNAELFTSEGNVLSWRTSWVELIHAEESAGMSKPPSTPKEPFETSQILHALGLDRELDTLDAIHKTYSLLDRQQNMYKDEGNLREILESILGDTVSKDLANLPSLEISATNSFRSVLTARARAVNHACLRELFTAAQDSRSGRPLNLSYHLRVLNKFLLLSDGMFATRFSHALFDPDLASAERSKGRARYGGMGLRLGSRSTWPPASSELQLALMGILTSAFENEPTSGRPNELPGDMSFALRPLSEEHIEKCLDQTSLEALDFLRIQYRPVPPLDAVITSSILEKYDSIQKLLLRMTRLVFVVNHSCRSRLRNNGSQKPVGGAAFKFIQAAHHFVTGFSNYLLNTAIGANWTRFMNDITQLEKAVADRHANSTEQRGVAHVRGLHERTMDNIMFACLLRKRHEKVRVLFEDILRLILEFASMQKPEETVVAQLHGRFQKQVTVFINVCKGLGDRKEYAGKEEGLNALVTRLTMNDFYSSNVERVLRL